MTNTTSRRESGFTLVELLIVVLIIGILATIAIPVFNGQRNKAKNSAAQTAVRNALSAARSLGTQNDNFSGVTAAGLAAEESSLTAGGTVSAAGATANPNNIFVGPYAPAAATTLTTAGSTADATVSASAGITICAASKGDKAYCMRSNLTSADKFTTGADVGAASVATNTGSTTGW